MLAIIKTGCKQYKVREGGVLKIEKLPQAEGSVNFQEILLVADGDKVSIGSPYLKTAKVEAQIIRAGKAKKIKVVHYKPKIRYHKVYGHRQPFTEVKITKITG